MKKKSNTQCGCRGRDEVVMHLTKKKSKAISFSVLDLDLRARPTMACGKSESMAWGSAKSPNWCTLQVESLAGSFSATGELGELAIIATDRPQLLASKHGSNTNVSWAAPACDRSNLALLRMWTGKVRT